MDRTAPEMKAAMAVFGPAAFKITGRVTSMLVAPAGAKVSAFMSSPLSFELAKRGARMKVKSSLERFARKAVAPSSSDTRLPIKGADRLYQPNAEPTVTVSRTPVGRINPAAAAPKRLPKAISMGYTRKEALSKMLEKFLVPAEFDTNKKHRYKQKNGDHRVH